LPVTFARYKVTDDAAHAALHEHWRVRLDIEPKLRADFSRLLAHYTSWMREQRRMQGPVTPTGSRDPA
jgi:hypothetical protein